MPTDSLETYQAKIPEPDKEVMESGGEYAKTPVTAKTPVFTKLQQEALGMGVEVGNHEHPHPLTELPQHDVSGRVAELSNTDKVIKEPWGLSKAFGEAKAWAKHYTKGGAGVGSNPSDESMVTVVDRVQKEEKLKQPDTSTDLTDRQN